MLKDLVKIANRLDSIGLTKEADIIDNYLNKVASDKDPEALAEEISSAIYNSDANIDESSFKAEFKRRWDGSAFAPSSYDPESKNWPTMGLSMADKMWRLGSNDPDTWSGEANVSPPKPSSGSPKVTSPTASKNVDWPSFEKNVNAKFGDGLGTSVKDAWKILTIKKNPEIQSFKGFVQFYNWLSKKKGKSLSPKDLISDMGELEYQIYVHHAETDPTMKHLGAKSISKEEWMKLKQTKFEVMERLKKLNLPPSIPREKGDPVPTIVALKNIARGKNILLNTASDEELIDMFRDAVEMYGASENPWLQI